MKLYILVACLALVVAAKEISSRDLPDVYDYHRRFGIARANELRKLATESTDVEGSQRIVGGNVIDIAQVPYQAGLVITLNWFLTSVCGASLISPNRLVTAAHCQYDGRNTATSMTVVLGTNTIFSGGVRITTRDVTMHPAWNPENAFCDIAVIRLATSVTYAIGIQPILLPDAHVNNNFFGWTAIASGFGATATGAGISNFQRLSAVILPIISNAECTAIYPNWMHDSNICTSGGGGRGTCNGDSGGPLAVNINNARFLVGVTSYGSDRGCEAGFPAAFARVTSFIPWIRSI